MEYIGLKLSSEYEDFNIPMEFPFAIYTNSFCDKLSSLRYSTPRKNSNLNNGNRGIDMVGIHDSRDTGRSVQARSLNRTHTFAM